MDWNDTGDLITVNVVLWVIVGITILAISAGRSRR